jgi:acetyl esterase/lipase
MPVINIHGGAFMLGSSKMVNQDQVRDCLDRGWIVLAPNHRLCPQVDLVEGPVQDCRDLLSWIHAGELGDMADLKRIFAFGTSSGGTLAMCLGFGVSRPVAGIYSMYGACNFSDPFWKTPIASMRLPKFSDEFLKQVYAEVPVPIEGGVSLEGQATGPPDFSDPRQAFALTQIANGQVTRTIFPSQDWKRVDPAENISPDFPPTFIVHGTADTKVPIDLSRKLYSKLKEHRVLTGMLDAPGEEHTFAAQMKVGSSTWHIQRQGFDFLESLLVPQSR